MRANLTYSVDFEDIPQEACRMIKEAKESAQASVDAFDAAVNNLSLDNLSLAIKDLEGAREGLLKADTRLGEVSAIVASYQKAQYQLQEAQAAPQRNDVETSVADSGSADEEG